MYILQRHCQVMEMYALIYIVAQILLGDIADGKGEKNKNKSKRPLSTPQTQNVNWTYI